MTTIQVCRTCLAHDTRMYTIANTALQLIYEKITNVTLDTQDGTSSVVCYICYHLLKKCHRFAESAVRANDVLQQISKSGIQITQQYIAQFEQKHIITFHETAVTLVDTAIQVSKDTEIPNVEEMSFEIKMENEQDEMAVDGTECLETNPVEYATHYGIKAEIEDTKYHHHHNSDSDDDAPLQSIIIKKENEDVGQESVEDKAGQRSKGILVELEGQTSSNENTAVEHTLKKVTIGQKGIKSWEAKCQDYRNKQSLITKKILTDSPYFPNNEIPVNVKNESKPDLNPNKLKFKKQKGGRTISKQKFICDHCGNTLTGKASFIAHIKIHTGEKPLTFIDCGKKSNLTKTKYVQIPSGGKSFTCKYCEKKFTEKYQYTRHVRIHSGEKPFTCKFCEKKFTAGSNLIRHIRTHTGEKPFTCNYCGKKFATKSNLTEHVRTHTGEKPFTCDYCGNKFKIKSHLTRHFRIHTGEKPFTCNDCDRKFTRKCDLTRHVSTHVVKKRVHVIVLKKRL